MKEQCFDESTIQAFLDGELSSELLESVARHTALCDNCSLLLQEAEEESAFAFSLLDEELNLLVPTERIRANVYQAISNIEPEKDSLWQRFIGFVSNFSNPTVAAFASLVIVFGIFALVMNFKNQPINNAETELASNPNPKIEAPKSPIIEKPENVGGEPEVELPVSEPRVEKVAYKTPKVEAKRRIINKTPSATKVETQSINGEAVYLNTIATLENSIKDTKDNVLRASSRVLYERDMAVVDDSIRRMKAEVSKNPKNEAAKQILRNSYQNKIELLNSVNERSEFMARLD